MAFDDETTIKNVDWAKMKERNIYNKVQVIFEAMEWWKKERGKKFSELFGEFIEKKPRKFKPKKPTKTMLKKAKDLGYKHVTEKGKLVEIDVEKDSETSTESYYEE